MLRYCILSSTMISVGPDEAEGMISVDAEAEEMPLSSELGPPLSSQQHGLEALLPSVGHSEPGSPSVPRGSDPGSRSGSAFRSVGVDSKASS